jgi:hypothetical protein
MPCSVIEPVPEIIKSVRDKVFRCSEVKPRIDCISVSSRLLPKRASGEPWSWKGGLFKVQGVRLTFVNDTLKTYDLKVSKCRTEELSMVQRLFGIGIQIAAVGKEVMKYFRLRRGIRTDNGKQSTGNRGGCN